MQFPTTFKFEGYITHLHQSLPRISLDFVSHLIAHSSTLYPVISLRSVEPYSPKFHVLIAMAEAKGTISKGTRHSLADLSDGSEENVSYYPAIPGILQKTED